MRLHFKGSYDMNPDSLPSHDEVPNAKALIEDDNEQRLATVTSVVTVVMLLMLSYTLYLRCGFVLLRSVPLAVLFYIISVLPHEILHCICYKGDVYLYPNFRNFNLFSIGTEEMSKKRYVTMLLLPNILFGIVPYIYALIFPEMSIVGMFGILCILMGAGDYYDAIMVSVQVPKDGYVYTRKLDTYWYK